MRFLVTEKCDTSSRCEFVTSAHIIEATSLEEAKEEVLKEKAAYFHLDRIELWRGHQISLHLIEETTEIDFCTFVDEWAAKKREELQQAADRKERAEYERLHAKFNAPMRNCWQPPR